MSYSPPAPPYVGPASYHGGPDNKPISRIVIHSTVSPCEPGGARNIAAYFRSSAAIGRGSAHYVVDPTETVQVVYDSVEAYHAPPNQHSLGIEMCDIPGPVPNDRPGSAAWKALKRSWRWVRKPQRLMLRRTARLTAELCMAYAVPPRYRSARALAAGAHGVTTHNEVSSAFHQSTHWDPGFWPRWWFMHLVRREVARIKKEAAR